MIRRIGTFVLAGLLASGSAAAQDAPPPPSPPPVRIVPVPSPRSEPVELPPEAREFREFYAEQCAPGAMSVAMEKPEPLRIILLRDQPLPLTVGVCMDRLEVGSPHEINNLSAALNFMAYKPLAPFWPVATEKWGPDMALLRQDLREQVLDSSDASFAFDVRSRTALAINTARGLIAIGYFDEARAKLDEEIAALAEQKARGRDGRDFDLAMLAVARAAAVMHQFGHGAAADYLAEFGRTVPLVSDYMTNVIINRAAYLAESGRHDEALEILVPAYEAFRAGAMDDSKYQVSGSDREFGWILACAYRHKGDVENARRYAAYVTSAEETPQDPYLQRTKASTAIKLRMYRCMDDPDGYFATWRSANESPLSVAWLEFQKLGTFILSGMPRDWPATRPEAEELSSDYRQLPEQYLPALTRWQATAATGP